MLVRSQYINLDREKFISYLVFHISCSFCGIFLCANSHNYGARSHNYERLSLYYSQCHCDQIDDLQNKHQGILKPEKCQNNK